ncbi:MAG TPA: DinB family protein [Gemmatimonadaceae bacterium]|nr:DinB family protein [Gemmatimonadaceae bacterium]
MDQAIAHVLGLMDVVDNLYARALHGLDPGELTRTPSPHSNPMVWMAGHLAQSRARLARLLGAEQEVPWPSLFRRGEPPPGEQDYPALAEIRRAWEGAGAALRTRLRSMRDAELHADLQLKIPSTDGTLRGAIVFALFHESYHVGQMGYVRRTLGKEGIAQL